MRIHFGVFSRGCGNGCEFVACYLRFGIGFRLTYAGMEMLVFSAEFGGMYLRDLERSGNVCKALLQIGCSCMAH